MINLFKIFFKKTCATLLICFIVLFIFNFIAFTAGIFIGHVSKNLCPKSLDTTILPGYYVGCHFGKKN